MTIDQWIEETAKQLEAEVESFRPSVLSAEVVEAREDKLLDDKEKITIDFLAIREQRDKAEQQRDGYKAIVDAVVAGYSHGDGTMDIPALCRTMPVTCWCGCHVSRTAEAINERIES